MAAIDIHHTTTSDRPWDGPANEARLRLNASESYYRSAYAWQDPDRDPQTKSAYRFIHHEVDAGGNVGPANLRACSTGIAVLNGGRGGTTIPDDDVPGVYRHLAAHVRDADREPPELQRAADMEIERRSWQTELRLEGDGAGQPTIVGYAAVFDVLSEQIQAGTIRFRERVQRNAFRDSLDRDVRALWNHDPHYVLGRTTNQTLRLAEDIHGLRVEITPPDTVWARDLLVSIRRGDLNQMSFAFRVPPDGDEYTTESLPDGPERVRILRRVELIDVSVVTFPAYPQTTAQVRSALCRLDAPGGQVLRPMSLLRRKLNILKLESEL